MIKGYNAYLDGVKVNGSLLTTPSFEFTGLASDTDYSDRIAMTAVDFAGNESPLSSALPPGTAKTPTRPEGPVALSAEDQAAVDAIVTASMAESGQPGVLVQITGPRGSYAKAYGNTKTTGGRPLTLDDHVRIGSATKAFTAMAVLKAIDDGALSFDDTLASFAHPTIDITKVPNSEKITVRQLLSMRAGVYDYQADFWTQLTFFMNPTASFSAASAVQVIVNHNKPVFEPDTSYAYSNSNYVLLGLILEVVRGKSIKAILTDDIITPLGMTETRWPSDSAVPEPAANSATANPELLGAAGALTSTIGDLTRWAEALRDHDLISAEMWDIWTSWFWDYDTGWDSLRYQSDYIPLRYGYGLGAESIGSWQGHPGGFLVGSSGWGIVPFFDKTTGATIAVAENKATSSPVLAAQTRIFTRIAEYLYPDSMFDVTHPPVPAPASDLGLDQVSAPISGFQSASGPFTAAEGADVFVTVVWDRPAVPTTVTYGGTVMTLLGSAFHDNDAANGGLAVYRLPGAGTGAAKTIAVSGAGGWLSVYGISFDEVTSVNTPVFVTGHGTALSQSVTNASGTTLQVFSAGAAGAPTYALGPISGGRNRAKQLGVNPLLWVNTTTKTGSISATAAGPNKWAALALHIGVVEQQTVKPSGGTLSLTGHAPTPRIEEANKVATPAPAALHAQGGRPGGSAFTPAGGSVSATGGTPDVVIESTFTPFTEENVTRTEYPVPAGASGVWVTLNGAGGSGGCGFSQTSSDHTSYGGSGGGGGAVIPRTFIPVSALGSTYSVAVGVGGAAVSGTYVDGNAGTASVFTSGSVTLSAGGGQGGSRGYNGSNSYNGVPGSASITGVSATGYSGGQGGRGIGNSASDQSLALGAAGSNGSGGGGGGGSGRRYDKSDGAYYYGTVTGGKGGDSTGTGGAGGTRSGTTTGSPGVNGGGGGGGASSTGGGGNGGYPSGGGGGTKGGGSSATSGKGGNGRTLVEWV